MWRIYGTWRIRWGGRWLENFCWGQDDAASVKSSSGGECEEWCRGEWRIGVGIAAEEINSN